MMAVVGLRRTHVGQKRSFANDWFRDEGVARVAGQLACASADQRPGEAMHRQCRLRDASVLSLVLCLAYSAAIAAVTPVWVPETGELDRATARAFASELIKDVETQALKPRVQSEYEAAKARLLALVDGAPAAEPRASVYAAARAMLSTLDTDGHTLLWSTMQTSNWQSATQATSAEEASAVRTVAVPDKRSVLVLRPPQTTFMDVASTRTYALTMIDRIRRQISADDPCAVVVDLGAQAGGSAWPAIAALEPLITAANTARLVDRDGARRPLVAPGAVEYFTGGPLPPNDLARLAGRPLAIVLSAQTASAGEMVAIALRGQPGARTFGHKTYGATTGNVPTALPDGATVLLTTSRYAFGNEPALRGPLVPDIQAAAGDSSDTTLLQAVSWAAQTCSQGDKP